MCGCPLCCKVSLKTVDGSLEVLNVLVEPLYFDSQSFYDMIPGLCLLYQGLGSVNLPISQYTVNEKAMSLVLAQTLLNVLSTHIEVLQKLFENFI